MSIEIAYATEALFPSFFDALDAVARERVFLEITEAPPFSEFIKFHKELIDRHCPVYFAVSNRTVVGWADINVYTNPRLEHRGSLGMGIVESHRGQGLGRQLLIAAIDHAAHMGLEKIELKVYTTNSAAIGLYRKMGFSEEGLIRKFRKLDQQYFDCLVMAKFL